MIRHSSTPGLTAALAAFAILLTACSGDTTSPASGGEDSSPSSPSGDLVRATRLAGMAVDTALTPGRYAMDFSSDQDDPPLVLIDVPAGYLGDGNGYEIVGEEGGFRHFGTWTVAEVAAAPCGAADWIDPGPSADDLAAALAALPVWESTRPTPMTIGGYEGLFMELNVPARLPAECHSHGQPLSWRDHLGGMQGIGTGKTQRLWIADVDGHRLMLVAGYFPGPEGPSRGQVNEMTRMVQSATFVDADQVAP
jgi:hypothetical protein